MGEYSDKVDQFKSQFKQTVQEPGFMTPDEGPMDSDNSPTIGGQPMDDGGDVAASPSDDQEVDLRPQRQPRKKHTNTYKRRIDQLKYENSIKDAQLIELSERSRQQEYLLSQQGTALQNEKEYKNAYYENNLQTREVSITNELKAAKEEGDIDKEIALSKALAQVTAEQATYGLYKNQLAPRDAPNYSLPPMENNIYPAPHIADSFADSYDDYDDDQGTDVAGEWLDANPWANPQTREYSPRLRSELESIASELDETLKYNGAAHMIGTPEYFSSLDNLMSERYSVQAPQQQQQVSRNYNNQSSVAPVSRRGASMADQYVSNNPNSTRRSVSLSEDEYKIARNLQIKGPNGQWMPAGDIGVKRYYESKRMHGDGSNKLTIE